MKHRVLSSPLGELTLAVTDAGAVAGLYLDGADHVPPIAELGVRDDTVGQDAVDQLADYFAGSRTTFEVELDPDGTDFQHRVWRALAEIPYGARSTYGEVAEALGVPRASRAVGTAAGRNPISIIVPCHRLVGSDGSLTGYAGGLDRKRWLLDLEGGAIIPPALA